MTDISGSSRTTSTKNFDWWFFHDAVILDTAGRYAIPVDETTDIPEWKEFLTLVSKYRKKEPLNGLILIISTDKLLHLSNEQLYATGQELRKRADQIMRALGAIFPIYIMITKTDLIYGMTDFIKIVDDSKLAQAMGFAYDSSENITHEKFLEEKFSNLIARLKDLRILLIQKKNNVSPEILIFPDEFKKIYPGLKSFFNGVFQKNPYQEDPMLRGIYFSSAIRKGKPESEFASKFSIGLEKNITASDESGIFIKDFFKSLITSDRNLFKPLMEFIRWKKLTTRLGIISWLMFCIFVYGVISFSFWKNMNIMNSYSTIFKNKIQFTGKLATDLILIDNLRLKVLKMENLNKNWVFPRLGFNHTLKMEKEIKNLYEQSFSRHVLFDLDKKIRKNIKNFNDKTKSALVAAYANHLAGRIKILEYFHERYNFDLPDDGTINRVLSSLYPGIYDTISDKFKTDYFYYIKWNINKNYTSENIIKLKAELKRIINRYSTLNWIAKKSMVGINGYSLNNFWGYSSERVETDSTIIPPYCTEKGKENIISFINNIKEVFPENPDFLAKEKNFYSWYKDKYFNVWAKFIKNFHKGRTIPDSRELKRAMSLKMTTLKNPYFKLLSTIIDETASFKKHPSWIDSLILVQKASKIEPDKKNGIIEKLKNKGNKVVIKIDPESARRRQNILELSKRYHDYSNSLEKLKKISNSPKEAFLEASAFFSTQISSSKVQNSLFFDSNNTLNLLKKKLGTTEDKTYSTLLLEGPLNYLTWFATMESGCLLQKEWEEKIIGAVQGMAAYKIPSMIFNHQDGLIYKFLNGAGKSFIGRNKNGFFTNKTFGNKIPFKKEFFTYITKGTEASINIQPSYNVEIKSLPLNVNKGSKKTPYGVILSLSCANKKFRLENYNYPSSSTFIWSINSCGDTILKILFKNFTLIKEYKGGLGFINFLNDFKDGIKVFIPDDFKEQTAFLKKEQINKIIVSFNISGSSDLLKIMNTLPENLPAKIINCWQ